MLSPSFTKIATTLIRPVSVAILCAMPLTACVEHVVVEHRHYHTHREVIVERGAPPPPQVEVIGVAPWRGAHWVRGHYVWRHSHWTWVRGHWA